jgi:hypothetical protein
MICLQQTYKEGGNQVLVSSSNTQPGGGSYVFVSGLYIHSGFSGGSATLTVIES